MIDNFEALQAYCTAKKGVTEDFPFDEVTLTYKVMGKIFLFVPLDSDQFEVAAKCDPSYAEELREQYEEVRPGYHLNKKHWNSILLNGSLPQNLIKELIDHSYDMVVKGLTKKVRQELESLE